MIREQVIADHVRGKRILDVGSVGQSDVYSLWDVLTEHSSQLTGIDLEGTENILPKDFGIQEPNHASDARMIRGNMETYSFDRKFEVVVLGDVIEHVSNQGLLLDNCKRHLEPNGKLIISTPNAKWPTVILRPNPTHTLWHDRYTLTYLLDRHGFRISSFRYYYGNKASYNVVVRPLIWRQAILVIAEHAS